MKKIILGLAILTTTFLVSCVPAIAQTETQLVAFGGVATGTDSYSVTISAITETTDRDRRSVWMKTPNTNTGAATMKVNGLTARAINLAGSALVAGDIPANQWIEYKFNLTSLKWEMQKPGATVNDAAADGVTKGKATFTANDFNSSSGVISIDYTNGQVASGSTKGFLTSANWTTFNNKFDLPSLTSGSVLFSNGSTISQNNTNFYWDNVNSRLGINTASPLASFHVQGSTTTTTTPAVQVDNLVGTNRFTIYNSGQFKGGDASGNLLFGTNSGLNINTGGGCVANTGYGVSTLTGISTGYNNTAIGEDALRLSTISIVNTAVGVNAGENGTNLSGNVLIGHDAGQYLNDVTGNTAVGAFSLSTQVGSGGASVGSFNTAIGYKAMETYNNTNGNVSTAVGAFALGVVGSGNGGNDAYGYRSQAATSSGTENVSVGQVSLFTNTTGSNNTAVGRYSMGGNTTGSSNTALGHNTLYTQTTANYNTAIGESVLANNTSGNTNTGIGASALILNTTGVENDAHGYLCLQHVTTGNYNNGFGANTFGSISTGTGNTGMGDNAGYSFASTSSYNTCYGFTAGSGTSRTGSNNVLIGANTGQGALVNQNVAVGAGALQTYAASGATAIGYNALNANTGVQNVALGWSALEVNSSGAAQTAVGYQALASNTTSADNTAVGKQALVSNTSGSNNTAVGSQALYLSDAPQNCAFGRLAAYSNTAGTANNAFGYAALNSNSSGNSNCAFGKYSLVTTTGSNNIAVGHLSGQYSDASGELFFHAYETNDRNGDTTKSLIYGKMYSTGANQRFRINGSIKIVDGTQGANKVLTSDANGLATWQSPVNVFTIDSNTTASDGATINADGGFFTKDATGSTYTLTNSEITNHSRVMLTMEGGITITGNAVSPTTIATGSVVISFYTIGVGLGAPASNQRVAFLIIN